MDNEAIRDMENDVETFCVSYVTGEIAKVGFERVVGAWNQHRIPGIFLVVYLFFFLIAFKE